MAWRLTLIATGVAALVACNPELRRRTCEQVDDCTFQETCVEGQCVPLDATDEADARLDAGADQEPSDASSEADLNPDATDAELDEVSCDSTTEDCSP